MAAGDAVERRCGRDDGATDVHCDRERPDVDVCHTDADGERECGDSDGEHCQWVVQCRGYGSGCDCGCRVHVPGCLARVGLPGTDRALHWRVKFGCLFIHIF